MGRDDRRRESRLKYDRTIGGVISCIYNNQKGNSKKRGHSPPLYKKEELADWIYGDVNFMKMYNKWTNSNYSRSLKPSVDRIDDNVGYSMDNIQLMTWGENHRKNIVSIPSWNRGCSRPRESYRNHPVVRKNFKRTCKSRGWDFDSFKEMNSGEKCGRANKYCYTIKEDTLNDKLN